MFLRLCGGVVISEFIILFTFIPLLYFLLFLMFLIDFFVSTMIYR